MDHYPKGYVDGVTGMMDTPSMKNLIKKAHGWLYCSRLHNHELLDKVPRLLYSESDTTNPGIYKASGYFKKKYDVIYDCHSHYTFNKYHKNWKLAKKCILAMIKYGLTVLVIGRTGMDTEEENHKRLHFKAFLPQNEFHTLLVESRILFVPSVSDASPRIITESLCLGTPVLVNESIFGGWKYVNDDTGCFFKDEKDVLEKIDEMIDKSNHHFYDTRDWYIRNYFPNGVSIANHKLKNFILRLKSANGM
jgi:hypothetical protein